MSSKEQKTPKFVVDFVSSLETNLILGTKTSLLRLKINVNNISTMKSDKP